MSCRSVEQPWLHGQSHGRHLPLRRRLAGNGRQHTRHSSVSSRILDLEWLCEDGEAIDLAAAAHLAAASSSHATCRGCSSCSARLFARRAAADMEVRLNAVGVPAARVRRLGEFLDEAQATGTLTPVAYDQGDAKVRTPGLGFRYSEEGAWPSADAPPLGGHTRRCWAHWACHPNASPGFQAAGAIGLSPR